MPPPTLNSEEPLNAPFGARCFLTKDSIRSCIKEVESLNAPFGARRFLTYIHYLRGQGRKRS